MGGCCGGSGRDPQPCLVFQVPRGDGGVLFRVHPPHPLLVLLFLPFHASVLEPDLDVALGEAEGDGQLHTPRSGDVLVEQELLLQLQQLGACVGRPRPLVLLCLQHVRPWERGREERRRKYEVSLTLLTHTAAYRPNTHQLD